MSKIWIVVILVILFIAAQTSSASSEVGITSMTVSAQEGQFLEADEIKAYIQVCQAYHLMNVDLIHNEKRQVVSIKCLPRKAKQ